MNYVEQAIAEKNEQAQRGQVERARDIIECILQRTARIAELQKEIEQGKAALRDLSFTPVKAEDFL